MTIKKYLAYGLILFIPQLSHAYTIDFKYDKYWSPYSGASYMLFAYDSYKYLDDNLLPSSANKTNFGYQLGRFGKLFVEKIFTNVLTTIQHEVFGHGYRLREFGMWAEYYVDLYGGSTYYYKNQYNQLNPNQQAAMNSGGLEAETVLGQQIFNNWLESESIDNRDTVFYYESQTSQIFYVYRTPTNLAYASVGNDIASYIKSVNTWHQNPNAVTIGKMRKNILWDLLDPALYNGIYGALVSYVIQGQLTEKLYMFELANYKYLPSARTLLAPWGLEYQIKNYIKTPKEQTIQVNLRYGNTATKKSYGLDLYINRLWTYKNFTFGNKLSLWNQPKLGMQSALQANNTWGIADYFTLDYQYNQILSLYSEIGYKTSGYIPGNPLEKGIVYALGLNLKLS
jgi:hypothetical protein